MDKWLEQEKMLCVTIYADTTGQFTEQEIEALDGEFWGQMLDIPVPENLMIQWFKEENPGATKKDFWKWFKEESTADDCDSLYPWLVANRYKWKRFKNYIKGGTRIKTIAYNSILSVESGTIYGIPIGTIGTVMDVNDTEKPVKLLVEFESIKDERTGNPVKGWIFESIATKD